MKIVKRILISLAVVIPLLMLWGWFNIWRSPAYYTTSKDCSFDNRILTMNEYGQFVDTHERPFIVKTSNVLIYGAEHTKDPKNVQMTDIKSEYNSFKPTVVLVEGRLGFLIPYAMNPVEYYGESGFLASLAKSDGIKLFSWELPKSDLILKLVEIYSPEQVALSQILSPYFSNFRFGKPDDPNQFVAQFLNRASYPGLDNVIRSVDDIDKIWQRDFAEFPDWRETSDQYGLPGYLANIADDANMFRNQHFLCVIKELTDNGERVFAICGSSHAVCLESAL